jgi:hypothetical protein
MQKKSIKLIAALTFCIIAACAKGSSKKKDEPYLLSHLENIRVFEREDHTFCSSLKLDFDKTDDLKSALYWRCRMSLARYRIYTDQSSKELATHNLAINDLITKISLKLADTPEAILAHENKKMDRRDHQRCVALGFTDETEDHAKIEDYFTCRKALISDQKLLPPFGNPQYMNYPNDSYNIGFVVDQRIDLAIKSYKEQKEKYPTCIKFNLFSPNFKNCTAAQDKSHQCFSEIEKKKFKKESEEKISCQKQSYLRFPNEFLRDYDAPQKEIERTSANSAFYNQQSFASLGISDLSKFDADQKRIEEQRLAQKTASNFNSKKGMYSRFELTRLRQKYIFLCQREANKIIKEYVDSLKDECDKMTKFEIIGEE